MLFVQKDIWEQLWLTT